MKVLSTRLPNRRFKPLKAIDVSSGKCPATNPAQTVSIEPFNAGGEGREGDAHGRAESVSVHEAAAAGSQPTEAKTPPPPPPGGKCYLWPRPHTPPPAAPVPGHRMFLVLDV